MVHITSNLGVGGSNPSERANKSGLLEPFKRASGLANGRAGRCSSYGRADSYGARGARQRSGGVEKYSSIASRQAPEHGSAASSPRPDSRISAAIFSAQLIDPGAEQPAARVVAIRLVGCQSEALAHHASTLDSGAAAFMMRPTTAPSHSTSKSSSLHSRGRRVAEARLRISWFTSASLLPDYAESGGYTERKKDRTQNKVIQATPAQKSDRAASKARSRVLASISAPD